MKKLILTCEHAQNKIPENFKYLFTEYENILDSHRGYDIGAFSIYENLAPISDKHFYYPYSRLLIEPNRSLKHKDLFSSITGSLDKTAKQDLIDNYYLPHRNKVEREISSLINEGHTVLHFAVHTFTPVLNNIMRNTDIGLLYDPEREIEKRLSIDLKKYILSKSDDFRVRFNYPYRGVSDGFITYLRRKFEQSNYVGIELEINQCFFSEKPSTLDTLVPILTESLSFIKKSR